MKKRLGKRPDLSDSLCLAFHQPQNGRGSRTTFIAPYVASPAQPTAAKYVTEAKASGRSPQAVTSSRNCASWAASDHP